MTESFDALETFIRHTECHTGLGGEAGLGVRDTSALVRGEQGSATKLQRTAARAQEAFSESSKQASVTQCWYDSFPLVNRSVLILAGLETGELCGPGSPIRTHHRRPWAQLPTKHHQAHGEAPLPPRAR